ncbi:hypothetical protein J6590_059452 [Homalodisca vitripennis]|nr:hypothetical protein J6590_059452 [Homalodisca vitripennis]
MLIGMPMAKRYKTSDFESELQIAQKQILSVIFALFISLINLVLYRLPTLFCLIRSSHTQGCVPDKLSSEGGGFS